MAALYGRLKGRGVKEVTQMGTGSSGIYSRLETWDGAITTTLEADGEFRVHLSGKSGGGPCVLKGNVTTREVYEFNDLPGGSAHVS